MFDNNIDDNILLLALGTPKLTRRARRAGTAPSSRKGTDTAVIVQGLRRIVKALHTYSQDVRRSYGLTGPQLWALKTLERHGRMSIGELASRDNESLKVRWLVESS